MKKNLMNTTVKDIAYLVNPSCLKASSHTPLEKLAELLCSSDRYKVYLEDDEGRVVGVVQAKHIAMKVLELSTQETDQEEMLPTIAFALNSQNGNSIAEPVITVCAETPLKEVLQLMDQNHIREIAVIDDENHLIGTLEAKNILSSYLQEKAEAYF